MYNLSTIFKVINFPGVIKFSRAPEEKEFGDYTSVLTLTDYYPALRLLSKLRPRKNIIRKLFYFEYEGRETLCLIEESTKDTDPRGR